MNLALRTGIPMSEWESAGEQSIVTALDILDEQDAAARRAQRG